MRRIKRCLVTLIVLLLTILMSSCTVFDVFSVDSLIRAPKLTGDNAAVQQAFESVVGSDISLVNPLLGDYRSAYVLFDYNKDGSDEAIVFYSRNDSPDEVHMNVLENSGDEWYSICDVAGSGSEVYKLEFVNLDRDQELEFAVTWTLSDSKRSKTLSLYKVLDDNTQQTEKRMLQIAVIQVTDHLVFDIDGDGQNEVFYTYSSISGESTAYSAALFRIDPYSYQSIPLSDIAISKNIDQILAFTSDIKDASYTIYIDCLATDGRYFTELLCYDYANTVLVRPQNENGEYVSSFTYRTEQLLCGDPNGDYMIEIPVQSEFEGSYYEDADAQSGGSLYITSQMQYADGALRTVKKYYRNIFDGFSVDITDFSDTVYAVYNADRTTQFRQKDAENEENLLFTISVIGSAENDDEHIKIDTTPLGESMSFDKNRINSLIEEI